MRPLAKLSLQFTSAIALALVATMPATAQDAATTQAAAEQSEDARINAWFDARFEEQLEFSPMRQTGLGRRTNYDQIDDFSVADDERQLEWMRAATAEMQASFDREALSDTGKLSWDMWMYNMARAEAGAQFRDHQYVLHQFNGAHTSFPTFLLNQHRVESESDMVALIARLHGSARALDQLLERAQANAAGGVRPPRFAYEGVIDQSRRTARGAPFDDGPPSAMWEGIEGRLAALVEAGEIDQARADELREEARLALTDAIAPAYGRIVAWFESDLPNTDPEPQGVGALPNGAAYYADRLAANTSTDLTAEQIHALGLSEVARITAEMEAIKASVGFEGSLQEFFAFLRDDDRFYFSQDDAGAQDYIDAAEAHIAFIEERLPEYFGVLPQAALEVKRVEPFREEPGAAQHYRAGTPDGTRPGTYYAHLSDMRAMPITTLEVIAYHEGLPGHHMQVSIAQETQGIPRFRSQGGGPAAFSEGWGLYAELLAKEMGAYEDPYSDFGRLTSEMWRAIRLVVDTGIHSQGWSEEQAVAYFLANSPIPETAVRSEVRRYYVMPGQATAYKIGMIRILELRAHAEQELGENFDIRGFHDTVLGGGRVPLSLLEVMVDNWIAEVRAGAAE